MALPPQSGGTFCNIVLVDEFSLVGHQWSEWSLGAQEEVFISEVVFGDVWLCSGQSNMVFKMNQASCSAIFLVIF